MKTRFVSVLAIGIGMAYCIPAMGQTSSTEQVSEAMTVARRTGWQLATLIVETLKAGDQQKYSGIAAWLVDFDNAAKGIDLKQPPDQWPVVDIDALVTNNPNFWQAHYEIAPGDPGLNTLHASLLLSVGESTRASHLIAVAYQRPGIPKELKQGLQILLVNTQAYAKKSDEITMRGNNLHDQGDYSGAMKEYQAAIALWPQNGFAHYEIGNTLREQQTSKAGEKKLPPNSVIVNGGVKNSPEVDAAFAKARKYDPFQLKAYQGTDKEVLRGLMALAKTGMPAWQKLASNPEKKQSDKVLEDFADACQVAGIHDLALVTRQILVARRKDYAPADHPFISKSLRELAPGEQSETVLKRLATGTITVRQLVVPERDEN